MSEQLRQPLKQEEITRAVLNNEFVWTHKGGSLYVTGQTFLTIAPHVLANAIKIDAIKTLQPQRRKGFATIAMYQLCAIADKEKWDIHLHVEPFDDEPLTKRQLMKWYRVFGFVRTAKATMRRQPQPVNDVLFPSLGDGGWGVISYAVLPDGTILDLLEDIDDET